MKDYNYSYNLIKKHKTSLIIIGILTILIVLYLRTNKIVLYEAFSDMGIMALNAKIISTPYWDTDINNVIQQNGDSIFIYTNNSQNGNSADYEQRGTLTFVLFKNSPPSEVELNTILYNNDNTSFNKDIIGEQIEYNTKNDFLEIGSIGTSNGFNPDVENNFLASYDYDINLSGIKLKPKDDRKAALDVIKDYIIDDTVNSVSNNVFYENIYNKFMLQNTSHVLNNVDELLKGVLNDDTITEQTLESNLSNKIKELTKNLLEMSLHIDSANGKVNYNTGYDGKKTMATSIDIINNVINTIPEDRAGVYRLIETTENINNKLGSIKIYVKLENSQLPKNTYNLTITNYYHDEPFWNLADGVYVNLTDDLRYDYVRSNYTRVEYNSLSAREKERIVREAIQNSFLIYDPYDHDTHTSYNRYKEYSDSGLINSMNEYYNTYAQQIVNFQSHYRIYRLFYDNYGTILRNGYKLEFPLGATMQTITKTINTFGTNIIINKIEVPVGVKLSIFPTISNSHKHELYVPHEITRDPVVSLDKNDRNDQSYKLLRKNISTFEGSFVKTLKYDSGSDRWMLTITNYSNGGMRNLIHHINYAIPRETFRSVLSGGRTDSGFRKINIFKQYLETVKNNLVRIKSEYNIIYDMFLNGSVPVDKILFLKPKDVPQTHIAIGHLAVKQSDYNDNYIASIKYKTVPEHCYMKVRDWDSSDKIYEVSSNGKTLSFYKNPETNTIIVQNNGRLPNGYVGKIVPCPDKNLELLKLEHHNREAKRKCMQYSEIKDKNKIMSNSAEEMRNGMLEKKIYNQSKNISNLKEYANKLIEENSKSKIINQEYNKNKLQTYLTGQKNDIFNTLNKLREGRNKYDININYPVEIIKDIISIIANSDTIPIKKKIEAVKKLKALEKMQTLGLGKDYKKEVEKILEDCPEFDMTGYFRRDPPCMGCRIPRDQE